MRGNRGARGLTDRAGKIDGESYTGDPAGVIAPWTGSGVSTPAIGEYPTIPIPIDDDDDGNVTMDRVDATARSGRKSTRDTTKARFQGLKILANFAAWFMGLADGSRSLKGLTVDGTGGASVTSAPGRISASENIVATNQLSSGGDTIVGGNLTVAGHVVGNLEAAGELLSDTGRQKELVFGPGAWQPQNNMDTTNAGKLQASAGPATARLEIPILITGDGKGAATLDQVICYLNKTTAGTATLEVISYDRATGAGTSLGSQTVSASGATLIDVTSIAHAVAAGEFLTAILTLPAAGDYLCGTLVQYTQNVF